jgi:XTP/dITP diphosphohydrolase
MAMLVHNKLVVATFNKHKADEIQDWFRPFGLEIIALSNYTDTIPPETGITFAENASIKARYGFEVTGLPTLADDSGLEVAALQGAPGVYSARFAGEGATDIDNNHKLLEELQGSQDRTARFRCAMALVTEENTILADGACEGEILRVPRGTGGFGYDPLFWLPDQQKSMAELTQDHKNEISHRAWALKDLVRQLQSRGWLK